jgi:hypothetical protein
MLGLDGFSLACSSSAAPASVQPGYSGLLIEN